MKHRRLVFFVPVRTFIVRVGRHVCGCLNQRHPHTQWMDGHLALLFNRQRTIAHTTWFPIGPADTHIPSVIVCSEFKYPHIRTIIVGLTPACTYVSFACNPPERCWPGSNFSMSLSQQRLLSIKGTLPRIDLCRVPHAEALKWK